MRFQFVAGMITNTILDVRKLTQRFDGQCLCCSLETTLNNMKHLSRYRFKFGTVFWAFFSSITFGTQVPWKVVSISSTSITAVAFACFAKTFVRAPNYNGLLSSRFTTIAPGFGVLLSSWSKYIPEKKTFWKFGFIPLGIWVKYTCKNNFYF